ncbi:MAG: hypothetical protein HQK99_13610 [Nitrospirae bacterium]|nr:hypothetical protein [Nitrospirota bacterium]
MTYKEAFYKGFDAANKNIMLPLIKIVTAYTLLIGFVTVLIIPVIVAALVFGMGIFTSLKDLNINNIGELLSTKYLLLAGVAALIVLLYILLASLLALYIYGAECGMIARGIKEPGFKFTMKAFFIEGKRFFGPVLWFTSIVWTAASIIILLIAASVFPLRSIINTVEGANHSLSTFITILSILAGAVIILFLSTGTFAVTLYGTAMMVFKGVRPMQASNDAVRFIFKRPSAFGFYMLCVVIYFAVNIMIVGSYVGVAMIPVIGTVLILPYQILVQAVQYYLGILFIAVLFSYYYSAEGLGEGAISGMSTTSIDISPQVSAPELSLPPQAGLDEGVH